MSSRDTTGKERSGAGKLDEAADPDIGDNVADPWAEDPWAARHRAARLWFASFGLVSLLSSFLASLWEQIRNLTHPQIGQNLREFLDQRQPLVWAIAFVLGICVAYAAIGLRLAIGYVQIPWLGSTTEHVSQAAAELDWWWVLLAPVVGGLIVGFLLHRFVPGKRAHSIADVIEARAIKDSTIPIKIGFWSAVLSVISIGFGASAGREGPVVHLGATLASAIKDLFKLSRSARRSLLACGVAAAISASFNAPIAAVLFAHEVILAHYSFRSFVPIAISSVTAAVISRLHLGNYPAFYIPEFPIASYWEFPAFALLGVTCAAVVVMFEAAMMSTERFAWRFEIPLWWRPAIGGLLIGLIAIQFPQVLGVGYDATDAAIRMKYSAWLMLALIFAKTAATAITMASRFAGGIFGPALYLGAMTGGAFGLIAASVFPEISSSHGLYAVLGMGAVSAAVLGAPISTTLIVFELTKGYGITIALLLTVAIANGLTQAALGFSYFHWQLHRRGLSVRKGPHKEIMRHMLVRHFMSELEEDEDPVEPLDPGGDTPWLMAADTLETALRKLDLAGLSRIAVVSDDGSDGDFKTVIGWVYRLNALSAYNQALIDSHVEEHH